MKVYGLDGCRSGWAVVGLGPDKPTFEVKPDLSWLVDADVSRVMIDMPIGLPQMGPRECDRLARKQLGRHASRVFSGAQRLVLAGDDYTAVNKQLRAAGHPAVAIQLWGLRPKIAAVDRLVRRHRHLPICECHPELVFQRLNDGEPLPSKHSPKGLDLRRSLLRTDFPDVDLWVTATRLGTGAKADDVLDACACALAARDHDQGYCLPLEPDHDPHGLPMQIWY